MGTISMRLASYVNRPVERIPEYLHAPFLGLVWVSVNFTFVWIGMSTGHVNAWSIGAGAFDGAVLSVIVAARASTRFQAGATGLLSGFSLDGISASGDTIIKRSGTSIHTIADQMLETLGIQSTEAMHQQIESAIVQAVSTGLLVVLAALLIKWFQSPNERVRPLSETPRQRSQSPRRNAPAQSGFRAPSD
jgi:hypothetical protein